MERFHVGCDLVLDAVVLPFPPLLGLDCFFRFSTISHSLSLLHLEKLRILLLPLNRSQLSSSQCAKASSCNITLHHRLSVDTFVGRKMTVPSYRHNVRSGASWEKDKGR